MEGALIILRSREGIGRGGTYEAVELVGHGGCVNRPVGEVVERRREAVVV